MQKKFNTIINGKGGVGKSFFAVNFVQYLKDNGIAHTAVDTDNENSTLKRFHPESLFLDIEEPPEIDAVFATLDKADLVVMDCRAASTDIFLDYFDEVKIFDLLKSMGASLNLIMPVNHETDSLEQIRNISERLSTNANYIIVKNEALSDRTGSKGNCHAKAIRLAGGSVESQRPPHFGGLQKSIVRFFQPATIAELATRLLRRTRISPGNPPADRTKDTED